MIRSPSAPPLAGCYPIATVIFITMPGLRYRYLYGMLQKRSAMNKDEKLITWFSRLLRWLLGAFLMGAGIVYAHKGGWPAILFGALILVTGFFKPKRCINEC